MHHLILFEKREGRTFYCMRDTNLWNKLATSHIHTDSIICAAPKQPDSIYSQTPTRYLSYQGNHTDHTGNTPGTLPCCQCPKHNCKLPANPAATTNPQPPTTQIQLQLSTPSQQPSLH